MITNDQLSSLHQLYWCKDSFTDKETQVNYLTTLRNLADSLDVQGLVAEIDELLFILEK